MINFKITLAAELCYTYDDKTIDRADTSFRKEISVDRESLDDLFFQALVDSLHKELLATFTKTQKGGVK